jgi:hypothetical protein
MFTRRHTRKGSALAAAMLFFVTITIAGTALLSISAIHRIQIVRSGMDVRLMIAAETGLETARGRFTLVAGVQDDWTNLVNYTSWTDVWKGSVNGIDVAVEGMAIGSDSVPTARVRSTASAGNRRRVVEYTIKISSMADYSLFFGGSSAVNVGDWLRVGGPVYANHGMTIPSSANVVFYGTVKSARGINYPESRRDEIFRQGYETNHPIITIPPETKGFGVMQEAAERTDSLFYYNTKGIRLLGEEFERTFYYRNEFGSYEERTEVLSIPDESVIYVLDAPPPYPLDADSAALPNLQRAAEVEFGGVLEHKRVSFAIELDMKIVDNLSYQTLLDNPTARQLDNKESPIAMGFREMMGIITRGEVKYSVSNWTPFPVSAMVPATDEEDSLPNQHSIDGILLGDRARLVDGASGSGDRQVWVTGGVLAGEDPTEPLRNAFARRYFDTDARLQFTLPPYFLRAYGAAPNPIPGTWRTYVPAG